MTGALTTPLALAVTWARPTLVGLQIWPAVSHRPAHATPGAVDTKLKTLGLLDVKVIGTVLVGMSAALKVRVVPILILLLPGAMVILLGVGRPGALLPPPHPAKGPKRKEKSAAVTRPEQNRRMHPPRAAGHRRNRRVCVYAWEFFSVEASRDLSKG